MAAIDLRQLSIAGNKSWQQQRRSRMAEAQRFPPWDFYESAVSDLRAGLVFVLIRSL
jgi:hypothetical protein